MAYVPNPNLKAELAARHKQLMGRAADAGAEVLVGNLSSPSHGTGVHYPRLPNRSSSEDQMPVSQSGELAAGVAVEATEGTASQVVIKGTLGKLLGLEFSPPSENPNQPGTPTRVSGGRAPVWRTMTDGETIEVMNHAMEFGP
jgi:hypothetical protein